MSLVASFVGLNGVRRVIREGLAKLRYRFTGWLEKLFGLKVRFDTEYFKWVSGSLVPVAKEQANPKAQGPLLQVIVYESGAAEAFLFYNPKVDVPGAVSDLKARSCGRLSRSLERELIENGNAVKATAAQTVRDKPKNEKVLVDLKLAVKTSEKAKKLMKEFSALVGNASGCAPCSFLPEDFLKKHPGGVEYRGIDTLGRSIGIRARLNKFNSTGGSPATAKDVAGWIEDYRPRFVIGRGHLLAQSLGGPGDKRSNLVTICQQSTNLSMYSLVEKKVREIIDKLDGAYVDYEVEAVYSGTGLYPSGIKMRALALDPSDLRHCWVELLSIHWNTPIPNETNIRNCPLPKG